ncbi:mitochondrial import inner membrane translocase subunit tim16-B-like isoform X2 [Actinia tenebrosa]|uniref:Mitochondrial import inner membrane translocase subunit tim16-B-like isoform X2 n=1 Tax=Actinia tenebrosa TaxID=6105 RepID=A0A6P8IHK1_ACTTE|nr:mitochondrial import inner membrane translocase subunit tim16-B-like isoform X2 [Actinia tenebrosa]
MAKFIAQIIILGGQVIGRAFAQALKQEFRSGDATRRAAASSGEGAKRAATNSMMGMTIQEAKQILNVQELDKEVIQKNFDHLFKINDKKAGGSFYLQSKVVRAKERIDEELTQQNSSSKNKESSTTESSEKS